MQGTYQVEEGGETLIATLVDDGERSVEITYINPNGDVQVGQYRRGLEVSTKVRFAPKEVTVTDDSLSGYLDAYARLGEVTVTDDSLSGYLDAYARLGPKLREQIPSDWHDVLGLWLAPKEE